MSRSTLLIGNSAVGLVIFLLFSLDLRTAMMMKHLHALKEAYSCYIDSLSCHLTDVLLDLPEPKLLQVLGLSAVNCGLASLPLNKHRGLSWLCVEPLVFAAFNGNYTVPEQILGQVQFPENVAAALGSGIDSDTT